MTKESNTRYLVVFVVLAAPFYLNDFASIYVKDWRWWLAIDYVFVKLFPLAVIAWLIWSKKMAPAERRTRFTWWRRPLPLSPAR